MINHEQMLMRLTKISPAEALDLVTEMSGVLNSISVQLRETGHDLGGYERDTLSSRLLRAWAELYNMRPLLVELAARPKPLPVDAPIWIGDEPPLDRGPSPV